MEKSFGLFFHLKKNKKTGEPELTVFMRVTVNGIYTEISTKRKCDPSKWNVAAGRMNGKSDASKQFNSYLDTLQQKVFEAKRKLLEIDHPVTAENIKNNLPGKNNKEGKYMLMEIFQNHNDQMGALVGHEYAPGTLERYKTSFKHTQSFLWWKYKLSDIDITKLDFSFITEYHCRLV